MSSTVTLCDLQKKFSLKIDTQDFYTITCYDWADNTNQSYNDVKMNFLDPNLNMKNAIMSCLPLIKRHTTVYLIARISEILNDVGMKINKITFLINDGETALKKACIELVKTNI